jgi:hypothetical protein
VDLDISGRFLPVYVDGFPVHNHYIYNHSILAQPERGEPMDPLLRGLCEQYIDKKLESDEIHEVKALMNSLDLPVDSKKETSFGFLLGSVYSQLYIHCLNMYNRVPNEEEIENYHLILRRRATEMLSRFEERGDSRSAIQDEQRPQDKRKTMSFKDSTMKSQQIPSVLGIPIQGK